MIDTEGGSLDRALLDYDISSDNKHNVVKIHVARACRVSNIIYN